VRVEHWRQHPLIAYVRNPVLAANTFNPAQWSCLIGSARRANLLCRLACTLDMAEFGPSVPKKAVEHFASARQVADSARRSTLREAQLILAALEPVKIPVVFLKGAAYLLSGLDAGKGRLLGDVDILVPLDAIDAAEHALVAAGWMTTKLNNYDQRYYRRWMHELPPMRHLERGTSLDVHHCILPPTARLKPDSKLLWESVVYPPGAFGGAVLAPVDLVLHSATHLFHEGEFEKGLRDLVDLHALLVEFGSGNDYDFWSSLCERACQLDLRRPLFYALRFTRLLFNTPIPRDVLNHSEEWGPDRLILRAMDIVMLACLTSVIAPTPGYRFDFARSLAFLRSHYLRMPMHLLLPHLARKLIIQERG